MFKECFFEPEASIGRKALFFPMSMAIHAAVLAALIVAPMIRSGALPEIPEIIQIAKIPLPPPSPPPPRGGPARSDHGKIKPIPPRPAYTDGHLVVPRDIPRDIADEALVDLPWGNGNGIGVPWGFGDGDPNVKNEGLVGDVIEKMVEEPVAPVLVAGDIRPPRLLRQVPPLYPEIARLARVEGDVEIEAQTDVNGRVVRLEVKRSIPLLDQAALDAVKQWVYEPMVINGKPRGVIFNVTVRFRLK